MKAAEAFEVVAGAMGLIEWLADEIDATETPDTCGKLLFDIWCIADTIRHAVNCSVSWEDAEKTIIAIRRRHEE